MLRIPARQRERGLQLAARLWTRWLAQRWLRAWLCSMEMKQSGRAVARARRRCSLLFSLPAALCRVAASEAREDRQPAKLTRWAMRRRPAFLLPSFLHSEFEGAA